LGEQTAGQSGQRGCEELTPDASPMMVNRIRMFGLAQATENLLNQVKVADPP
jgi:hypothetical protein